MVSVLKQVEEEGSGSANDDSFCLPKNVFTVFSFAIWVEADLKGRLDVTEPSSRDLGRTRHELHQPRQVQLTELVKDRPEMEYNVGIGVVVGDINDCVDFQIFYVY